MTTNNVFNPVKRTERGWGGHFCGGITCSFRRNTLLECENIKIVVSTVGRWRVNGEYRQIGHDRFYETMAFHSDPADTTYHDADVRQEVAFESPWAIRKLEGEIEADQMHEAVVAELSAKLRAGQIPPPKQHEEEEE
jgi:hypothetical protein